MMKKITELTALLLMLTMAVGFLFVSESKAAGNYVIDDADIFYDDEIEELNELIAEYRSSTGISLIVATTYDTGYKTTMEYADDLYDSLISGSGALYLIDMDNRQLYISTAGDAKYNLQSSIDGMLADMKEEASDGDYLESAKIFLKDVDRVMHGDSMEPGFFSDFFQKGFMVWLVGIIGGVLVGGVYVGYLYSNKGGKLTVTARDFLEPGNENLRDCRDMFVHRTVTRHRIKSDDHDSGGGFHSSSSGTSHGGGGTSF